MSGKIWLVTGVSGGIGKHIAEQAALAGNTVIGTVRKQEQIEIIENLVPDKTFAYLLDVNNQMQVKDVVINILQRFGRIDVLVNNAGYGLFGAVEETSLKEVRDQMETNFFGALALTQEVLPYMRKNKSGHIFQISSIAGISSSAGLGIYNASKFALEGFSEALAYESAHLGIKVTLVEPGPFRTEWAGSSLKFAAKQIPEYKEATDKLKTLLVTLSGKQPGDPQRAAKAIVESSEMEKPPLRLAMGNRAIEVIQNKINLLQSELSKWEELARNTDFPS